MIRVDRELLQRLAVANRRIGGWCRTLIENIDGGDLPARELRGLADDLVELAVDLRDRADDLDYVLGDIVDGEVVS